MIEAVTSGKKISSCDLWQIKILSSLLNKRHFQDNLLADQSSLLLAPELLNSLLIKIKMKFNEKILKHKDALKSLMMGLKSFEKIEEIDELMQLANYTDLPLQFNVIHSSLLQFLFEFKKHRAFHQEIDFISNLWKIAAGN